MTPGTLGWGERGTLIPKRSQSHTQTSRVWERQPPRVEGDTTYTSLAGEGQEEKDLHTPRGEKDTHTVVMRHTRTPRDLQTQVPRERGEHAHTSGKRREMDTTPTGKARQQRNSEASWHR